MKQNALVINTATCDMRNITREILEAYSSITVNAADVIVTPEVQVMIADYNVSLNCANVLSLDPDTEFIQQNGVYHIRATDQVPERQFFLAVNGCVMIETGTQEILKKCGGMGINGRLLCPRSVVPCLPRTQVNGRTDSYPDGAVVLKNHFTPDQVFVLRARKQDYFVPGKAIFLDESLDYTRLAEAGVHLIVEKALVSEPILPVVLPLLEETAEVIVLEAGTRYVDDDLTLTEGSLKKYGSRLYVDGDVILEEAAVLDQLEKLTVNGELRIREELEEDVYEKGEAIQYQELKVLRGIWIGDRASLQIDAAFLERNQGVITVADTARVEISAEVTPEQIEKQLRFCDCAIISCSKEQRGAVELVTEDVAKIDTEEEGQEPEEQEGRKVINTSAYTF